MLGQDNNYPPVNFYGHAPIDIDPWDQHVNVQGDHAGQVAMAIVSPIQIVR